MMDWLLITSGALFLFGAIILAEHARRSLNASIRERTQLLGLIQDLRSDRSAVQKLAKSLETDAVRRVELHAIDLQNQILILERENIALSAAISKITNVQPVVYAPNLEKSLTSALKKPVEEEKSVEINSWSDLKALKDKEKPE